MLTNLGGYEFLFSILLSSGLSFIYTEISPNSILHILYRIILHIIVNNSFLSKKIDKKADILNSRKTSFTLVQKNASSSLITTPQKQIGGGGKNKTEVAIDIRRWAKQLPVCNLRALQQNLLLWLIYEISMMVIPLGQNRRLFLYVTLTICYARYRNLFK